MQDREDCPRERRRRLLDWQLYQDGCPIDGDGDEMDDDEGDEDPAAPDPSNPANWDDGEAYS